MRNLLSGRAAIMVRGLAVPLVCAALAGAPVAARAADSAAPPFGSSASGSSSSGSSGAAGTDGGSWLLRPVWAIGGAVKSIGSGAASVWGAVAGLATPFRPSEALPDQIGDDDRRFFAVLNSVGLQLGEIKVEGTLISYSNYRFVATRQPSVADLERAERKFAEYRANSGGPRGWAKQRIAR